MRKAHLNGVVDDQEWVFVELPPEFHVYGRIARIRRWLYGMRKAATSWEKNYAEQLAAVGFKGSRAAPTTFCDLATKVRLVVHGDDFTFSGTQVELEKIRCLFKKWYDVKDRGIMESGTMDIKEVVILGRTLKFTEMGLEYTADGKHKDAILEELGLESEPKSLGCPALGADKVDEPGDENEVAEGRCHQLPVGSCEVELLEHGPPRHPVRREGVVHDDVEADPKVVEATEAAEEVPCGQGGHDVGVQGGRPDGHNRRVCGLGLGRRQAAAQEHIRRPGDRGRNSGQELVTYSTWPESQFC